MRNTEINVQLEEEKLKKCRMFTNRGFMVTIARDNDNILFYPHMISNFSIDGNRIFVTLYDIVQMINIESELDKLLKGFWFLKEKLKITLFKLDSLNEIVYNIVYEGCKLKKYHGKNFTYKSNDPHQWYLEFTFNKKKIVKNNKHEFKFDDEPKLTQSDYKKMSRKDIEILRNTNKMLEEAASKIKNTSKLNQLQKNEKILEIDNAKAENENALQKYYSKRIQGFDLKEIERNIEQEMTRFEDIIKK